MNSCQVHEYAVLLNFILSVRFNVHREIEMMLKSVKQSECTVAFANNIPPKLTMDAFGTYVHVKLMVNVDSLNKYKVHKLDVLYR